MMGARWMPWPAGPTKGAGWRRNASGSGSHAMSRGYPNGAIRRAGSPSPLAEHIGQGRRPGELKHLSTLRKRKDVRSSGERNAQSPNRVR
jgi:hypothetical protein